MPKGLSHQSRCPSHIHTALFPSLGLVHCGLKSEEFRHFDGGRDGRGRGLELAAVEPSIKDPFVKGGDISSPTGAGQKL